MRLSTAPFLAVVLGVVVLGAPASAAAQSAPPVLQKLTLVPSHAQPDDLSPGERAAIESMRLSLEGLVPSMTNALATGCSGGLPSSPTAARWPVTGGASVIRLIPNLTLAGYSQQGCTIDSRVGGVLSFVVPLTAHVSFALEAGAISLPNAKTGLGETRFAASAHVVVDLPERRALTVGVTTSTSPGAGLPGFVFGGQF